MWDQFAQAYVEALNKSASSKSSRRVPKDLGEWHALLASVWPDLIARACSISYPPAQRNSRTRIGRSRFAQARSAVSTSAGSLRTVRARQQRSPGKRFLPPLESAHRASKFGIRRLRNQTPPAAAISL